MRRKRILFHPKMSATGISKPAAMLAKALLIVSWVSLDAMWSRRVANDAA